jgi:L-threonylcarbamoyladenylate synthase
VNVFRAEAIRDEAFNQLVSILRSGGVIAFPTDTAYGLGADPFNDSAVDRIFNIKGRPETKPILLLVDSMLMAESIIQRSDAFRSVAETFWPGPLTIVTQAAPVLSEKITAGTNTVGLRWPSAPFANMLVSRFGGPITATSANQSGLPSTITAEEVRDQLGESVDALVDGGVLAVRGGSTVLDLTADPPVILREGPVTFDSLAKFFNGRLRRHVA